MSNIISKEKAIEIIDQLNFRSVVTEVTEKNPESPFHSMDCYLDLEDGEVFFRVMGNNESFQENKFICIFSQPGNFKADIQDDAIAGDDIVPDGGVEMFEDYDERVIDHEVWRTCEGNDEKSEVYHRIDSYYNQLQHEI